VQKTPSHIDQGIRFASWRQGQHVRLVPPCGMRAPLSITVETLRLFEALFMLGKVAPLAAVVLTRPELPEYMS
jgi:hypothetical protein